MAPPNSSRRWQLCAWCFVCLLLCLIVPAIASAEVLILKDLEKVTAVGMAPLTSPDPKGAALKDAFRNAVEQALGGQVKSETLVQDARLISDRILIKSEGYVKKWHVLKETQEDGALRIEIAAFVSRGDLNKALFMNGIDVEHVYDWIGKPRLLVLISEQVDDRESPLSFAQAEVESLFMEKGVTVLSGDQIKNIRSRDVKIAFDSPDKAVALGNRYGAEIVIVGKSISRFSRAVEIAGFKQAFYSTLLEAKAYRTSNAEILMSKVYTETPGETDTSAMGEQDAAVRSIRHVVRTSAKDIVFQVVKNWYEGLSKSKIFQLVISGVKGSEVSAIEKYLTPLPDVINVFRRSYNRGTAEVEVEYNGDQRVLVDALENNNVVPLSLVSEEPFRCSFEKSH